MVKLGFLVLALGLPGVGWSEKVELPNADVVTSKATQLWALVESANKRKEPINSFGPDLAFDIGIDLAFDIGACRIDSYSQQDGILLSAKDKKGCPDGYHYEYSYPQSLGQNVLSAEF